MKLFNEKNFRMELLNPLSVIAERLEWIWSEMNFQSQSCEWTGIEMSDCKNSDTWVNRKHNQNFRDRVCVGGELENPFNVAKRDPMSYFFQTFEEGRAEGDLPLPNSAWGV